MKPLEIIGLVVGGIVVLNMVKKNQAPTTNVNPVMVSPSGSLLTTTTTSTNPITSISSGLANILSNLGNGSSGSGTTVSPPAVTTAQQTATNDFVNQETSDLFAPTNSVPLVTNPYGVTVSQWSPNVTNQFTSSLNGVKRMVAEDAD